MKKQVLYAFMILLLFICLLPTVALAEETHEHSICHGNICANSSHSEGHGDSILWTPWQNSTELPTSAGNYYLTGDVTINSTWPVSQNINLDLNGHKVTLSSGNGSVISVANGAIFTLCDCKGTGLVTGGKTADGAGVYVNSGGTFNMYGGSITGNYSTSDFGQDCVYKHTNGYFNFYGGTVGDTWGGIDWAFTITASDGTGKLTIARTTRDQSELGISPHNGRDYEPGVLPVGANKAVTDYYRPYSAYYNKISDIEIKEGVISIGSFVFANFKYTGELVIPSTVKYIGWETFNSAKISKLTFTEGGTELCIAHGSLKKMINLEEIVFPRHLTCLHAWQFGGCTNLKNITIQTCTYMQGTKHHDTKTNFEAEYNVSWGQTSGLVDGLQNASLETVNFGSEEVRNMFFENGRNGNSADGIESFSGLSAYVDLQDALDAAAITGEPVTLVQAVTVASNETIMIPEGVTLITSGNNITIKGTLINAGTISGTSTINVNSNATFSNAGTLSDGMSITGSGKMATAVIFNTNGSDDIIVPIIAVAGEDISEQVEQITSPTKSGYVFSGWAPTIPEIMPEGGLHVKAKWTKLTPHYTITSDIEGITVDSSAKKGDIVTITVDENFLIDGIKAIDKKGNPVIVTREGDNYSFIMPYGGVTLTELTNNFEDVSKSDYYFDPVLWAEDLDIVAGTSETKFSPNNECTRAQLSVLLWRAAGCPEPTIADSPFTDVDMDSYYGKAVLWALEQGITSGTSATTFDPDAPCTRAQAISFLCRMVKGTSENNQHSFTDVDADSYYSEYLSWSEENGIATGTSDNTFSPNVSCTRAHAVTFLWRCMAVY